MSRYQGFRVNGWTCNFTTFSASELTTIADIPGQIQRLWRSRGQLPGGGRKSGNFDAREAAEIMVRYDLSRLGVPPSETDEIGSAAAQIMLWFALLNSDGTCEVNGTQEDTANFLKRFQQDERIAGALTAEPKVQRYLWKAPGDKLSFATDIAKVIEAQGQWAMTFLDLEKSAFDLAEKAGKPLFSIDVSGDAIGRRVRRLTGQRPSLTVVK